MDHLAYARDDGAGRASSIDSSHIGPIRRWLIRISRFGLAALFLFTAIAKLVTANAFAANVSQLLSASGINYVRWMWPVTVVVIALELLTTVLLLINRTVRIGAILAGLLLTGFAGFALYYVYALHGEPLECGCFGGIIASQLGVKTALRNLALLIPVAIVFFGRAIASSRAVNESAASRLSREGE